MVSIFDGNTVKRRYRSEIRVTMPLEINITFIKLYHQTLGFVGVYPKDMAEREGFEPPIDLRLCLISSQVHSTGLCHLSAL
jgi:hypothetical protein